MSAAATKKTTQKKAAQATHPTYKEMVKVAIIKNPSRQGCSRQKIKAYLVSAYGVPKTSPALKGNVARALKKLIEEGKVQTMAPKHPSSFKVVATKVEKKKKAPKTSAQKKKTAAKKPKTAPVKKAAAKKPKAKKTTAGTKKTTVKKTATKKPAAKKTTKKTPKKSAPKKKTVKKTAAKKK